MSEDKHEIIPRILEQGTSVESGAMRLRLIKQVMQASVDQSADYVIMAGCHHPFRVFPLRALMDLLDAFGLRYTLLSKEFCCGHSTHEENEKPEGEEKEELAKLARDLQGRNLARARELGASSVITFCANCYTHYKVFSGDQGLPILYWTDIVTQHIGQEPLANLLGEFDFYEGCHREQNVLLPRAIDTNKSTTLLGLMDNPTFNEVPPFCCKRQPEKVFGAMKTSLLVTPTPCCFGRLSNLGPPEGVRIRLLVEVIRDAYVARNGAMGGQRILSPGLIRRWGGAVPAAAKDPSGA